MTHAGLDQAHAVDAVVDQVAERQPHALADLRQRGEVEHRVPGTVRQHPLHRAGVGQIGDDQRYAGRHRAAMAGAQIVEHHHAVAALAQRRDQMTADIARPAGDQKSSRHSLSLPEVAAVARMVHFRIGVTRPQMDADVHLRQGCTDHIGVRLLQAFQGMQREMP